MLISELHPWPTTTQEAVALQTELASRVKIETPDSRHINLVAGVDVSCQRGDRRFWAAVVVWNRHENQIIETSLIEAEALFPYIPGLLSFRELPPVLEALRKIQTPIDAVICDGQGLAHPRLFGLACHLGLWLDLPTVGCAKSRLVGEYSEPDSNAGDWKVLTYKNRIVGSVLRSRKNSQPLFISPGHLVDFDFARKLVWDCCRGTRLPEPVRLAHLAANRFRVERQACTNEERENTLIK
ncbi:MAG: endonuclease V [bacterium]|nr:endonuclease V [bacterium]